MKKIYSATPALTASQAARAMKKVFPASVKRRITILARRLMYEAEISRVSIRYDSKINCPELEFFDADNNERPKMDLRLRMPSKSPGTNAEQFLAWMDAATIFICCLLSSALKIKHPNWPEEAGKGNVDWYLETDKIEIRHVQFKTVALPEKKSSLNVAAVTKRKFYRDLAAKI